MLGLSQVTYENNYRLRTWPSAVAVIVSSQMLGKGLQQWAQNYTRQPCPLTSFYLSLRQALHHLKCRDALKALIQGHRTMVTAARWAGRALCPSCCTRSNFYQIFFSHNFHLIVKSVHKERFAVLLQAVFPLPKAEHGEDRDIFSLLPAMHSLTLCHVPAFCIPLTC